MNTNIYPSEALRAANNLITTLHSVMPHPPTNYTMDVDHLGRQTIQWQNNTQTVDVVLPSSDLTQGFIVFKDSSVNSLSVIPTINLDTLCALLDWDL